MDGGLRYCRGTGAVRICIDAFIAARSSARRASARRSEVQRRRGLPAYGRLAGVAGLAVGGLHGSRYDADQCDSLAQDRAEIALRAQRVAFVVPVETERRCARRKSAAHHGFVVDRQRELVLLGGLALPADFMGLPSTAPVCGAARRGGVEQAANSASAAASSNADDRIPRSLGICPRSRVERDRSGFAASGRGECRMGFAAVRGAVPLTRDRLDLEQYRLHDCIGGIA